ncbi:MAG: class 1 isoprenoid biosynthesis enzyme [Chitinophagaceae bacterium]|nr:class 1 isoprenoid biosynthesis enzyme [Chitinophagaceae bacterium]
MKISGTSSFSSNISLFSVIRHLYSLYAQMKKQEKDCKERIPAVIAGIIPPEEFSFSPKEIQRITKYYQLALNLVCDNIYLLTGKKLSDTEHKSILQLSIFVPLIDDLFDEGLLPCEQIMTLISEPEKYTPVHNTDRIAHRLYCQLLDLVPHRERFIRNLTEGVYWENESLKQFDKHIGEEELMRITYNKSYYSILLFCSVLNHYPCEATEAVLYPVSGLMQLTNDVFDVWKDTQKGLYTIPNLYADFGKLESLFLDEISAINTRISSMGYPEKNRKAYLIRTHTLHAMGWMSLQQLKAVASEKPLRELSRKELVCDLDNIPQQIRWVKHVRQLCNYAAK